MEIETAEALEDRRLTTVNKKYSNNFMTITSSSFNPKRVRHQYECFSFAITFCTPHSTIYILLHGKDTS